jgi:dTDP-glucose 4,6-dehydratase
LDKLTYAANPENLADVEGEPRYRLVRGDIADRQTVERIFAEFAPEFVVNFAAESHVDRSILDAQPFVRTNVEGTHALLEAVRAHGVTRFLQISTDEVYGDIPFDSPPATEEAPLKPSSPYSATKAAADLLCFAYARTYGIPLLVARPCNNYGPNQFPEKLIPLMIRNALAGEILPVYGDGEQVRDWIYVEEAAEAIGTILERGRIGAVYNVSAGDGRRNRDVVELLCQTIAGETGADLSELRSRIRSVPDRPGHDRRYATDGRRLREELGFEPKVDFPEGLRRTVRWYLTHRDWVERVVSGEYRSYYDKVYRERWGAVRR